MKSKATERIKKRLTPNPQMGRIGMSVPRHVVDELKEIAVAKGFSGYQGLIRFYVSQGMRKDLEEPDAPDLEKIAQSLKKRGVAKAVIEEALLAA